MLQSQAHVAILRSKTGRTSDFPQSYFCPTNYLFAGNIITYKFTPKELAIENILHIKIIWLSYRYCQFYGLKNFASLNLLNHYGFESCVTHFEQASGAWIVIRICVDMVAVKKGPIYAKKKKFDWIIVLSTEHILARLRFHQVWPLTQFYYVCFS